MGRILDDGLAVSSLHFSFIGGMGGGERIFASPWSGVVKGSNSLWDGIYDARGMGRYDESTSNSSVSGGPTVYEGLTM